MEKQRGLKAENRYPYIASSSGLGRRKVLGTAFD